LHARLAVTYEPQWGSDVFGMYQSLVEGRPVPWSLLVKDFPERYAPRLHIVEALDWEGKSTEFQGQPLPGAIAAAQATAGRQLDRLRKVKGKELFSAKELTVTPGRRRRSKTTAPTD